MTAKIVRFPYRNVPVDQSIIEGALIIVLPVIRIERYAEPGDEGRSRGLGAKRGGRRNAS